MIWLMGLLVAMMLAAAVMVLVLENHIAAVAAASIVSLGLSVVFVLLRASDVPMTEAAVAAGWSSPTISRCTRPSSARA